MASSRRILGAAGGGFGAGLLLLAGGLVVKHSQAKMVTACSSGPGKFGQALGANTARQCDRAHDLSSMATGAMWIGAILLVIAVGGCIAFLAAAGITARKKPKVVVPEGGIAPSAGPGRGAPAPSRAGEGAVLRPVVPVAVGQPVAAGHAGGLPGPGCGHEVDDGARFCTVCGSPVAGGRDVFAADQPVSVTGLEITTVLPVFAPPEPVGVPAMATGEFAERSLAGVAPGAQLSWADRPLAPGGVDASPPWGWADPPPAPGGTVTSDPPPAPDRTSTSAPPWEQAGPSPVSAAVKSAPPWEQAGPSPVSAAVKSAPPWEQAGPSPAPGAVKSGPPWEWAEPSPAPDGTSPGPEGMIPRQSGSGRHRSRRP